MIRSASFKYAVRSLLGHPMRSILSMAGIGVGCAIALFAKSYIGGEAEWQIRAVSESGAGHLSIVANGWLEKRENSLRLADWERALATARSLPGVKAVTMRARANGLLAFGNRMAGVEITGVDPEMESRSNRIVYKAKLEGRYLQPDDYDTVVIGGALARRLDVELDDDLYVTMAGREEIQSAMLRIVGILETGSRDIDASICHVTLQDIERMSGYAGPGEINILLTDYRMIEPDRKELASSLSGSNTVITWKESNPGIAANVEGDTVFMNGLAGIIVIVVALGIASAQLTTVLERRHEFAVISALGMKGRQVITVVALEAVVVGVVGALVALGLGGSAAYYLSTRGIDFGSLIGEGFGNVLFEPHMYGVFGPWLVWYALAISVTATALVSVYPAWLATRVDPAEAMRKV